MVSLDPSAFSVGCSSFHFISKAPHKVTALCFKLDHPRYDHTILVVLDDFVKICGIHQLEQTLKHLRLLQKGSQRERGNPVFWGHLTVTKVRDAIPSLVTLGVSSRDS